MTNNDVLRRIRYTFDFDDSTMMSMFGLAGLEVTRAQISDWLKKEEDPDFKKCSDRELAIFLNGLIVSKRGKKDGPQPEPSRRCTAWDSPSVARHAQTGRQLSGNWAFAQGRCRPTQPAVPRERRSATEQQRPGTCHGSARTPPGLPACP